MKYYNIIDDAEKHIALYVLSKFPNKVCDKHKLFKIMYLAYRDYLAASGKQMFEPGFKKLEYGPVPFNLYPKLHTIKEDIRIVNKYSVQALSEPDLDYIAEAEREFLDRAIEEYKDKSFAELTAISHDCAWDSASSNHQMDIYSIAQAGGADEDMIEYIRFHNEEIIFGAECAVA